LAKPCVPTNQTHAKQEHTQPNKCSKVKVTHFDMKKTNLTPTQLDPDAKINKKFKRQQKKHQTQHHQQDQKFKNHLL